MKESFCQSTFPLALSKHVDKKIKNKTSEMINTCAVDLPLSGHNSHPLAQRTDRYLAWYGETPAIFQTDGRDHRLSASTRAIRKLMNGHGGLMPVWSSIGLGWNCGNRREAHRLMLRRHLRFFFHDMVAKIGMQLQAVVVTWRRGEATANSRYHLCGGEARTAKTHRNKDISGQTATGG